MRARNMSAMTNSGIQPQTKSDSLEDIAGMYPQALSMAAAANSRAGQALQSRELAGRHACHAGLARASEAPPAVQPGLHQMGGSASMI